ncbi:hypothetical protein Fot_35135 [Forsythia ovata]|uniref:Uncharacterized protein n=1 Tax=Forsythia ovata TaxID=205694 RepID=A0ABD1SKN7_9LAMI
MAPIYFTYIPICLGAVWECFLERNKGYAINRGYGRLKKAKEELAAAKDSVAEAKTKVVRTYKKKFPKMPKYAPLTSLFMDGDQLTEMIRVVHPEWDLSILLAEAVPCTEAAAPAISFLAEVAPSDIPSQALHCVDPKEAARQ